MTTMNNFSTEPAKDNRLPTIVFLLVLGLTLLAPPVSLAVGWTPTGSLTTAEQNIQPLYCPMAKSWWRAA